MVSNMKEIYVHTFIYIHLIRYEGYMFCDICYQSLIRQDAVSSNVVISSYPIHGAAAFGLTPFDRNMFGLDSV